MASTKAVRSSLRVLLVLSGFLVHALAASAQTSPDTYWVSFTDKASTPYSLDAPEEFLSPRAMQRRLTQGIAYDESDLPVDPAYVAALEAISGADVLNRSKWFNGVTVRVQGDDALAAIHDLPFVAAVRASGARSHQVARLDKFRAPDNDGDRDLDPASFGPSYLQLSMLNGQFLHDAGAQGQGMLIGVLDSGFGRVDSSVAFDALRTRGGILHTRDLVDHDGDVFADHWHGLGVLSCMAARLDSALVGTAPEADYVLIRTEDVHSEYPVEEDNWISGAELADSLGCDVLNTSLGYTTFDDSTMDHTYAMLDGHTLRISIAANIASRKGMIPVCSAGNNGENAWRSISAPADAIDVLTVGAVGDVENHAPFSSHGPSADGRVKPDVCAMGWGTTILRADTDSITQANGTSFAAPVVAGLVACLWQLNPGRTSSEIMEAVRRSASFFTDPNDSLGYGVPDFGAAHAWLTLIADVREEARSTTRVFPSPFQERFSVQEAALVAGSAHVALFDGNGRAVLFTRTDVGPDGLLHVDDQRLGRLPSSTYVVVVEQGGHVFRQRIIKAP